MAAAHSAGGAITRRIEYLTEDSNHTGYSQVLQETTFDASGVPTQKVVYSIGHDQVSQTTYTRSGSSWGVDQTAFLGTDGHGSVRVLFDAAAAVVEVAGIQQVYHFDAYGNLIGHAWTGPGASQPITSYLYSGESFDFTTGQQYLRARWYDASTGRFNRLDPYFGNNSDLQSFHKYAYVHGDPIQGIDPTGMFLGLGGILGSFSIRTAGYGALTGGVLGALTGGIDEYLASRELDKAIVAGVFGGVVGAGLGFVGGGFAGALGNLSVGQAAAFLKFAFVGNLVGTVYGVSTSKTVAQAGFRGTLGAIGSLSSITSLRLLGSMREQIFRVMRRLAWDAEQKRWLMVQAVQRSPEELANAINRKIRENSAPDEFVIDTLGLSDADAIRLEQLINTQGKKVTFLRD